jgi:endonuclease-3
MGINLIKKVLSILIEYYKGYSRENLSDPVDELIRTVLSQNTTDINSDRAFERLKVRFPKWNMLLNDSIESELVDIISPAGLGPTKAKRIIGIIGEIRKREGAISLDRLRYIVDNEALSYLMSIKGVGAKTAYCVMAFSFGRDLSPVDTHVHRVASRIGILPEKVSKEKAHKLLNDILPEGMRLKAHFALINHGRQICRARKPQCARCIVSKYCNYYKYINRI